MNNKVDIFSLYEYLPNNILNKFENKNLVVYFISLIIIIFIAKTTKNFSYVFICLSLLAIYIYYCQLIQNTKQKLNKTNKDKYMKNIGIDETYFISKDDILINILNSGYFIKEKSQKKFINLIKYIEDYLTSYHTLRIGTNNIFAKDSNLIKPIKLTKAQKVFLQNDVRDKLDRILKHIESIVFIIPKDSNYLDAYYKFYQHIKDHLIKYHNTKDPTVSYRQSNTNTNSNNFNYLY